MIQDLFSEVDTMPIPVIWGIWSNQELMPTVRQLREYCGLTYFQVALVAGVHPRIVYWMERGIAVHRNEAHRILSVLSRWSGHYYALNTVRGIRLKPDLRDTIPIPSYRK